MTVTSVVQYKENVKKEISYPVLMINIDAQRVVLFTSSSCGTVVERGKSDPPVGYHSSDWVEADNASVWEPFTGQITLFNNS